MANLSITTECNRHCPYCFARPAFNARGSQATVMSLDTLQRALDFLERSRIDQVRLLGGEPTLHPQFPQFIEHILKRGLRLLVFSNGLMPEHAIRCLENTPVERASILLNVSDADHADDEIGNRLSSVFKRLGPRVLLGVNIHKPAIEFEYLLELIEQYNLTRTIRLGLAHPSATGENHFLPLRDYPTVGQQVASFAMRASSARVELDFDCGFVPCMFSAEDQNLVGNAAQELGQRCNPILDILPDGQVISCYPLAHIHQEPLPQNASAAWLRSHFEEKLKPYRSLGIFRECSVCPLRSAGKCLGGCLAMAMRRLRHEPFMVILNSPPGRGQGWVNSPPGRGKRWVTECQQTPQQFTHPHPLPGGELTVSPYKIPSPVSPSQEGHAPIPHPSQEGKVGAKWVVPYIDQPLSFWEQIASKYGQYIKEVYFPLPDDRIGSGRPPQPTEHLEQFLRDVPLARSVLINPIILPAPVEELAPQIIEFVRRLIEEFGVTGATVANVLLAERIHDAFPEIPLTASVLMDIAQPCQASMLQKVCAGLVPASRIMRDLPALKALREAFPGRIRLIVNEACLPGCPFRVQHFYEMGSFKDSRSLADSGSLRRLPDSLCDALLQAHPWLRLTGAWVLPQHLDLYEGLYDELKLAGRVTLRDPQQYLKVLDAYIHRSPLFPNEIGGGPASILEPLEIRAEFFAQTLHCGHYCHTCTLCKDYYEITKSL